MADITQAIRWLKEDRCIRRKAWVDKDFMDIPRHLIPPKEFPYDIIYDNVFGNDGLKIGMIAFRATDWEIFVPQEKHDA